MLITVKINLSKKNEISIYNNTTILEELFYILNLDSIF